MSNKNKDKTKIRPKKSRITKTLIAEAVGTSEGMVSMVLSGKRSNETTTGQRIEVAKLLLEEKIDRAIAEVKETLLVKAVKKACPL